MASENTTRHPIVDCHVHVFDPVRFPYAADAWYLPVGPETGSPDDLGRVLDAHGVAHALLVGPNSGYNLDNRRLLDTMARSAGRYKLVALRPPLEGSGAQLLFDHTGRPDPRAGVGQAGFAALLALAQTRRA